MITGENGIIKKAVLAKEDIIVLEEKDTIEKATILAMQKNKYGNIEENELENELNKIVGTGKINVFLDNEIVSSENSEVDISDYVFEEEDSDIIVEFISTNHKYLVNMDGTISEKISTDNTDWEKINYEIRTDENENQYCVVTGLKNGISKTNITMINIAKKYKGIDVISVEGSAFFGCTNISKIKFPTTLKKIGEAAFYSCNITEIVFPDSLEEITGNNNGAFANCKRLEKITFGKGIKKLGDNIFRGCTDLSHVKIPRSITSFGARIFADCPKLTKVGVGLTEGIELESNITEIPALMFNGCTNITEVTIPNTVIRIGEAAFYKCNITEIRIPDSVEKLNGSISGVFQECANLENVELGANVVYLGNKTFYNCSKLQSITYKGNEYNSESSLKAAGVTYIGTSAFTGTGITTE